MNAKHTWTWLIFAAALFAFIFFFERHWGGPAAAPTPLLPGFRAGAVTAVGIFSGAQPEEVRMELTNANWWITRPHLFPAERGHLDLLLKALEQTIPATSITRQELLQRTNAEAEYGLDNPQSSLVIQQGPDSKTVKFGRRTAPGNQVYVQVVGREDVYVVDADLLPLLSSSPDAWRDRALVNLQSLKFDGINITNAGRVIKLQYNATNQLWRFQDPFPLSARAYGGYLTEMLQQLQSIRITGFVPDEKRGDLDALGLQPPDLSIGLTRGDALAALLQFGKTNATGECYARRDGLDAVVKVPSELLAAWRQNFAAYRDIQLITPPANPLAIEFHGADNFILEHPATNEWRVTGEKFRVEGARAHELLNQIAGLEIVDFVKDVVSTQEFGTYGLTSAWRQLVFKAPAAAGGAPTAIQLDFGATNGQTVYVRRSDESSVYAVALAQVKDLPVSGWQLRSPSVWSFNPAEVQRITVRKGGWARDIVRTGNGKWGLGNSQGVLDVECTAEMARQLGQLNALAWVARGPAALEDARLGFGTNHLALAVELKGGGKLEMEFGGSSATRNQLARTTLDGEPWVFEFPPGVFQFLRSCWEVPAGVP